MTEDALYQKRILALARAARALPALPAAASHAAVADNPVCGDRVRLEAIVGSDGAIAALAAEVRGCVLCEASAGLLADHCEGGGIALAQAPLLAEAVAGWIGGDDGGGSGSGSGGGSGGGDAAGMIDGLDAFTPVRDFPSRHKCVSLPFVALARMASDAAG